MGRMLWSLARQPVLYSFMQLLVLSANVASLLSCDNTIKGHMGMSDGAGGGADDDKGNEKGKATLSLSAVPSPVGYSGQLLIVATILNDASARKWCLSQSQTVAPSSGIEACLGGEGSSNGWSLERPTTFNLSGTDGSKTVYLWLADEGDKVGSSAVAASIALDRTAPTGECSGVSGLITSTSVSATAGCSDSLSGCSQSECRLDSGSWGSSCSFSGLSEGARVIEVRGIDLVGNIQTSGYGTCSFTVDLTPPTATLSGTPDDPSSENSLNVTVGGSEVTHYRYKVGIGMDCSSATGYSTESPVAVAISDSMASVGTYTLCVVGRDLSGHYQAYPGTQATWSHVLNLPPVVSVPANRVFPLDGSAEPVLAQDSLMLVSTATDPESNTPITWPNCVYETVGLHISDPNYAAPGTSCTSLASYTLTNGVYLPGGTASFSSGTLTWIPTVTQRGTFRFTVTAQDSLGSSSNKSFFVTVHDRFSLSQFVYGLDPLFSIDSAELTGIPSGPRLDATATDNLNSWPNMKSVPNLSLSNMSPAPWIGNGTPSSAYSLHFNGSSNSLNLGSIFNSYNKLRFSTWMMPGGTAASTIISNSSATKGFEIRQGGGPETGKLVMSLGSSANIKTYREEVLADTPTGYWMLDEPSSTSGGAGVIQDVSGANYCFGGPCHLELPTDSCRPDLGEVAMNSHFVRTTWFDGGDDGGLDYLGGFPSGVEFNYSDCSGTDEPFTLEAWINLASGYSADGAIAANHNNQNVTRGYVLGVNSAKKLYMRLFDMDSDSKRIGRLFNTGLTVDTWYHVAMTYSGSETNSGIKLYLNGLRVDDTNDSAGAYTGNRYCGDFTVGRQLGGGSLGFHGSIDEVAVYTGELSASRILAHYNAGVSTSYLVSEADFNTSYWNQIVAFFDGSLVRFFLNGQAIGALTPVGGWDSNGASPVYIGSSSLSTSFWGGDFGGFKLFGSSDGSSVGSESVILSDFAIESNRYRSMPIENIKTSNLILHLDAANAQQKMAPFAVDTGCTSNTMWSSILGPMNGGLFDFNSCGTYGWKGNGSSASPYRLKLDGFDSAVWFDDSDTWSFTDGAGNDLPFSMEIWMRFSNFTSNPNFIAKDGSGCNVEYYVWAESSRYPRMDLVDQLNSCGSIGRRGSAQLLANTWYQLVFTYSGAEVESGIKIYVNGTEQSYVGTTAGSYTGMSNTNTTLKVGRDYSTNYTLDGDIGIVRFYNTTLTPTEIVQNCHAQKNRFSGLICQVP